MSGPEDCLETKKRGNSRCSSTFDTGRPHWRPSKGFGWTPSQNAAALWTKSSTSIQTRSTSAQPAAGKIRRVSAIANTLATGTAKLRKSGAAKSTALSTVTGTFSPGFIPRPNRLLAPLINTIQEPRTRSLGVQCCLITQRGTPGHLVQKRCSHFLQDGWKSKAPHRCVRPPVAHLLGKAGHR